MRKLKHYQSYLKRLETFCSALNVKLVFTEVDCYGVWLPASNTIKIDDNMSNSDTISTLLHELGHSMDDIVCKDDIYSDEVYDAYRAMYKAVPNKRQTKLVVDSETVAWRYGRDIAKRLKIRLGKWYDDAERDSIADYKGDRK